MIIDEIKKANMLALKNKDEAKKTAYSVVINKYMLANIEKRAANQEFTDIDMVAVLQKAIKELVEEKEIYEKAGRVETANQIEAQKNALEIFLPKMMSEEEIRKEIDSLADKSIGSVMKHFKTNFAGKCDMRDVQNVLKSL